jgi:hypothetical protein
MIAFEICRRTSVPIGGTTTDASGISFVTNCIQNRPRWDPESRQGLLRGQLERISGHTAFQKVRGVVLEVKGLQRREFALLLIRNYPETYGQSRKKAP